MADMMESFMFGDLAYCVRSSPVKTVYQDTIEEYLRGRISLLDESFARMIMLTTHFL